MLTPFDSDPPGRVGRNRALQQWWCGAAALAGMLALVVLMGGCFRGRVCALRIPAGAAAQTLKEFARQAQIQIIFDARSVEGVVTNAIDGRMEPAEALERMVRGTPLYVRHDDTTGAFAIIRRESTGSRWPEARLLHTAAGAPRECTLWIRIVSEFREFLNGNRAAGFCSC